MYSSLCEDHKHSIKTFEKLYALPYIDPNNGYCKS